MRRFKNIPLTLCLASLALAACQRTGSQAGGELDPKAHYRVEAEAPATLQAGRSAPLRIAIVPMDGGEIKEETPLRITLSTQGPLQVEKRELRYADKAGLEQGGPVFEIPVSALEAGAGKVDVDMSFFVCIAEACLRTTEQLAFDVTVQP